MVSLLLDDAGDALAVGEALVRYCSHPFRPGAPERITATIPDVKLIHLVREPIARIVSHRVHNVRIYIYAEYDPLFSGSADPALPAT